MEVKTISLEDFKSRSNNRTQKAFNPEFEKECIKAITENKGSCVVLCSLADAFKNYEGKGNAKPSKIVAVYFIQLLKKIGYSDSNLNRVSINRDNVNLRL